MYIADNVISILYMSADGFFLSFVDNGQNKDYGMKRRISMSNMLPEDY
jgi:hypothetical protein